MASWCFCQDKQRINLNSVLFFLIKKAKYFQELMWKVLQMKPVNWV